MSNTQLLALLIGGCIGLALCIPFVWGMFAIIERRDRDRLHRELRKEEKRRGKR